jgi:ketosteroid isomerase-like protein
MSRTMASKELRDHVMQMIRLMDEKDFHESAKVMADDVVIVRPSGNPLTKDGWLKMLDSDDIVAKGSRLLDIHIIDLNEELNMGYVVYTTHSKFSYKGADNDDVAVFVTIFKKNEDGEWKLTLMQRSTGRKPSDPMPVFE